MSPAGKSRPIRHLDVIEGLLHDRAEKLRGEGVKWPTPHELMEALKGYEGSRSSAKLTPVGEFIQRNLRTKDRLEIVRWVVFHLDFPVVPFAGKESDTRNWFSVLCREQNAVDGVHRPKVSQDPAKIYSSIYAPGILASRLPILCPDHAERLRRVWWLYTNEPVCPSLGGTGSCCHKLTGINMICFADGRLPNGRQAVLLTACKEGILPEGVNTLGALLTEDEKEARRKFLNFRKLIFDVKRNKGPLRCNFYARIPVFFGVARQYMTEVFVAFREDRGDVTTVVGTLHELAPALKLCVSLVNSQVAYSVGEYATRHETARILLRAAGHEMSNLAQDARCSARNILSRLASHGSSGPLEEEFGALSDLQESGLLALLSASGLKKFGPGETVLMQELRTKLEELTKVVEAIEIDLSPDLDLERIPGPVAVVVAELLRNAVTFREKAQGVASPARLSISRDLARGKLTMVVQNKGTLGKDRLERLNDPRRQCPDTNTGCWICMQLVRRLSDVSKVWWEETDGNVRAILELDAPEGMGG